MFVGPFPIQIRFLRFPGLVLALMLVSGLTSPALLAQAGEAPAKPTPTAPRPVQSNDQAPSHPSAQPDPPKPKRTTRRNTRYESQEEAQKYIRERSASRGGKSRQAPRSIIKPPSHPPAPHPATPHPAAPHPPAPHPGPPK